MKRLVLASLFLLSFLGTATGVQAAPITIASNTEGLGGPRFIHNAWPGQSFTTMSGGPWHNITFNFYDRATRLPTAAGQLFLFDQEYLGKPADLDPSASGYLAASMGIMNGLYMFAPSLMLMPDTTYFVYSDTPLTITATLSVAAPGYMSSLSPSGVQRPFEPVGGSFDFNVSGELVDAATVPEPTSLVLLGSGVAALIVRRRRRAEPTTARSHS